MSRSARPRVRAVRDPETGETIGWFTKCSACPGRSDVGGTWAEVYARARGHAYRHAVLDEMDTHPFAVLSRWLGRATHRRPQ